jgi:hypothetical protein
MDLKTKETDFRMTKLMLFVDDGWVPLLPGRIPVIHYQGRKCVT